MLKEYKNIYLYPNGEDAQAIYVILKNFKTLLNVGEINILDDAREETSLAYNHQRVKENGILWIVHQDRKMYNILFQNAKNLPQEIVRNGIIELEEKLLMAKKISHRQFTTAHLQARHITLSTMEMRF